MRNAIIALGLINMIVLYVLLKFYLIKHFINIKIQAIFSKSSIVHNLYNL